MSIRKESSRLGNRLSKNTKKLELLDDTQIVRKEFEIGETIYLVAHGLRPFTVYAISLSTLGRKKEIHQPLAGLMTDRHGTLPISPLLPFLGLGIPGQTNEVAFRNHDEAEHHLGGMTFAIQARVHGHQRQGRPDAVARFVVAPTGKRPQVIPSDTEGRLQTGIIQGSNDVALKLRNFPRGCVKVYMVPRQFDWQVGDPIEPVHDSEGAQIIANGRIEASQSLILPIGRRGRLGQGSYQFIARSYRLGWYNADDLTLLPGDVVSSRRIASLVVRLPYTKLGLFENGITLTPEIAGRPLAHRPYFRFVNNFPKGTDVWAALDPSALPAGLLSRRAAIYVIAHKSAADWAASSALADISGPGMTPAVKIVPIVPGCINWNETLVWPNPQTPGKYDIVIDFGNNAADPALFATDATLDPPLDMIDGYVRVGFYVTEDPSLPGPYAGNIGQHEYNNGVIQVSTSDGINPTDWLPLKAVTRYPAQFSGVDAPFAAGSFPLILIMHGNSGLDTSYLGYNYLLEHLASHGFIAVSIYAPINVMIDTRAQAILQHLAIMAQKNANPGLFQGHVDLGQIGIMGHSRGGEAVIRAAKINTSEGLGWNLQAGISIAPTDYHHYGDPSLPLLVIYGANDGDVSGAWPNRTGFDIYDEAGRPRSFVFVYGATHDRFNTEWASIEASTELTWDIALSDLPHLISLTDHQNVAKGYAVAFFQAHLQGKNEQLEFFSSGLKPSLASGIQIHTSYQAPGSLVLDNFEQHDAGVNSLGGAVTPTALATAPVEDELHTIDSYSPHITAGGDVQWNSAQGVYLSSIPTIRKDVSAFAALSFRVTQKYGSPENPINQPQDLYVRITDRDNKSRRIPVSIFTDVPYPYLRGFTSRIKSALKTVRIPLLSYTIANLGADKVDLTNIQSISFEFDATSNGEIEIDDIEFSL